MWNDIVDWLKKTTGNQPDAYSRITRTPIYKSNNVPEGALASYLDKVGPLGGYIKVPPGETINSADVRHEEGHSLFDKANLGKYSDELAPQVERGLAKFIKRSYDTKDNKIIANEGLGYTVGGTIGDSPYLKKVYEKLQDPVQKQQFLRLVQQMYKLSPSSPFYGQETVPTVR